MARMIPWLKDFARAFVVAWRLIWFPLYLAGRGLMVVAAFLGYGRQAARSTWGAGR